MTISDSENPWPYPWRQSTVPDFDDYQKKATTHIQDMLGVYGHIKHGTLKTVMRANKKKVISRDGQGIDDTTRTWMEDVDSLPTNTEIRNMGEVDRNRSTAPVYETQGSAPILRAITFKIRYTEGYPIIYEGSQVSLELVVFHAMRSGSNTAVMLAKVVYDGGKTENYFDIFGTK